jgi:hypothetical protein
VIQLALEHRALMREHVPFVLQAMAGAPGYASGVATVISADDSQAGHILDSSELEATLALLACARLVQQPLPVRSVANLLDSKNKLLATAAERYLLAEDSRDARQFLWAHFPRQAFITGWREPVDRFAGSAFDNMNLVEQDLRNEVMADDGAPREIYALLDASKHPNQVLRIYRDRAVYTHYESDARYREGPISVNDLTAFRKYVSAQDLTVSGPQLNPCEQDPCQNFEFMALTNGGARRTLVQSSYVDGRSIFWRFRSFDRSAKTRYRLDDTIKGVEVLIDDPAEQVKDVWQDGTDLRVRILHRKTSSDLEQDSRDQAEAALVGGKTTSAAQLAIRHRQLQREHAQLAWYGMQQGRLLGKVDRPAPFMSTDETDLDFDNTDFSETRNGRIGQASAGSFTVLAADPFPGGLWLKPGVSPATLISTTGYYRDPVVSADGKWVVATRPGLIRQALANSAVVIDVPIEFLIRLDLSTGEETKVNLPAAKPVDAVTYVPALRRFVIRLTPVNDRYDSAKTPPNFYLLDPTTGDVQPAGGNFLPLLQTTTRMLQPTLRADEYWAAIPDRAKNETQVGRYDVKDFSFHPVMTIPHIAFDSMSMWVDEPSGKLLIVFEGQLIRIPLTAVAPTPAKS